MAGRVSPTAFPARMSKIYRRGVTSVTGGKTELLDGNDLKITQQLLPEKFPSQINRNNS